MSSSQSPSSKKRSIDDANTALTSSASTTTTTTKSTDSKKKQKVENDDVEKIEIKILIFDIEGTTTSISFVHDTLFPFVRENLSSYLNEKFDDLTEHIEAFRKLSKIDIENKVEGVIEIPDSNNENKEEIKKKLIENILWQMNNDRKSTELKSFQGLMWKDAYEQKKFTGHIYKDVLPFFKQMKEKRKDIYIYSSGSVAAQKLLFGFSDEGDLLHFFKDHFDTKNIGNKLEKESYEKILKKVLSDDDDIKREQVLFVTDNLLEARPAKEAGLSVLLSIRPGTMKLPEKIEDEFQCIKSFEDIQKLKQFKF